jgi:hypothetical protein
MTICSLRHETDATIALRKLASPAIGGLLQRWWSGPLRGVAEIYIPYRLYRVSVEDRRSRRVQHYALDSASGTLDPYQFAALPESQEWTEVEAPNCHPVKVEERRTRELAIETVRRRVFSRGFYRMTAPRFTAELIHPEFYLPYWVGFYGDDRNLSLKVMNAIRQTMEGSRVCHLLKTWLMERPEEAPVLRVSPRITSVNV